MDSLKQNRMIIFAKILYKLIIHSRRNYVWLREGESAVTCLSFIHMNGFAELIQLIRSAAFVVAEIMQVDANAESLQHLYAVEHIDGAAVIGRPWHIQAYNMQKSTQVLNIDL